MAFTNAFRRASLTKELQVIEEKVDAIEQAESKVGPLACLFDHHGDVPYFVAGAFWRGLHQHVGMSKKDAEAAWKVQWKSHKADYVKSPRTRMRSRPSWRSTLVCGWRRRTRDCNNGRGMSR